MTLRDRIASAKGPLRKLRKFKIIYNSRMDDDGYQEELEKFVEYKDDEHCSGLQWACDYAYGLTDKHYFKIMEEITEPHHRHGRMVSYWVEVANIYSDFSKL